MPLTCDENHIYTNDQGLVIPNVTRILEMEGFTNFSGVSRSLLESAQQFGSNVHFGCELSDKGRLDYETLDPLLLPYIKGWKQFLSDFNADIILIETMLESKIYKFCGTIDRVLKINGKNWVVDLKTGKGCSLQTAAYKILLDENMPELKIKSRMNVRLLGDASYKVQSHENKAEEALWKSIVNVHNSRINYNKGVGQWKAIY